MQSNYEKFIKDFDQILEYLFESQKQYIKCKKGCAHCCKKGDYPFSEAEFRYLTEGYIKLSDNQKIIVQQNIRNLLKDKEEYIGNDRFEHSCPFLINDECCVYEYRGIICRTFGLSYFDEKGGYFRLPDCVSLGLNYSQLYDNETKTVEYKDLPKVNLRIDRILNSNLAKRHGIECGEIRPMLDWLRS